MHAKGFLHKTLTSVIHKARANALTEVVFAAINTKELVLSKIGRAFVTIQERSGIQKVNRLLGNSHLFSEKEQISETLIKFLISPQSRPIIIIDWSKYPNSEDGILRAALAAPGRAITLYEEVHAFKKSGNRKVQRDFLKTLKRILPADCVPIITTDAGFHNVWFQDVLNLGWNYVGRVRGLKKCRLAGKDKFDACKKIFKKATHKVEYMGECLLTKKNPLLTHLYLIKGKLKGRKKRNSNGKISKHKDSKAYARSQREPWLLASSLSGRHAAKRVLSVYKKRMTIEEAFRDMKSPRYGFGLDEGKTKQRNRRSIMLLIGMLASLLAWLVGLAGENQKLHYKFQSNSVKTRRVISLFYLGCQLIRKQYEITLKMILEAIASLDMEAIYE